MEANSKFLDLIGVRQLHEVALPPISSETEHIVRGGFEMVEGVLVLTANKKRLLTMKQSLYEDRVRFESSVNRFFIDSGEAKVSAEIALSAILVLLDSLSESTVAERVKAAISLDGTEASVTFFQKEPPGKLELYGDLGSFDQPVAVLTPLDAQHARID